MLNAVIAVKPWLVSLIAIIWNACLRIPQGYYERTTGTLIYHWNVFGYCVDAADARVQKQ